MGEINLALKVFGWACCRVFAKPCVLQDSVETMLAHHVFEGIQKNTHHLIRVVQPAQLHRGENFYLLHCSIPF